MPSFPPRRTLFQWAARFGYAARGAVYLVTGAIAVLAATEFARSPAGTQGAIAAVADWPLGRVWLFAAGTGLLCFAAWRGVQAVFDPDDLGGDAKGRLARASRALSGLVHLGLAWSAFELLDALEDVNEDAAARQEAGRILDAPFGEWLLYLAAAAVLGVAAGNVLKGLRHDFSQELFCPRRIQAWAHGAGRVGYLARGAVFMLLAASIFAAGFNRDASDARSLGGTLQALERLPFGSVLMSGLGLGFAAFGVYGVMQALFRRIRAPEPLT